MSKNFALSQEPTYRTVEKSLFNTKMLRFEGSEILALALFCETLSHNAPELVARCERGNGRGPLVRVGLQLRDIAFQSDSAALRFFPRKTLFLSPEKAYHRSGLVISAIETLPGRFPEKEYLAFREKLLRDHTLLSFAKKPKWSVVPAPR